MPRSLRIRARLGQLPGEISKRAIHARRSAFRINLMMSCLMVPILMFADGILIANAARDLRGSHTVTYVVDRVTPPTQVEAGGTLYEIFTTDGTRFLVDHDPGIGPGETMQARYNSANRFEGTLIKGVFDKAFNAPVKPSRSVLVLLLAVSLMVVLLTGLIVAHTLATALWARHDIRALESDMTGELIKVEGHYDGSHLVKPMAYGSNKDAAAAAGFPVRLTTDDGRIRWLVAPLAKAGAVKRFEGGLRSTSRRVIVECGEATGIITAVRSATGAELTLAPDADDHWDPEAGLPL